MTTAITKTVSTSRGAVEYVEDGEGEPVLCLHGAMGGYDQSSILGRTIGPPGYRYIALSRPGYLGTSIAAGKSAMEQADLYADGLTALGIPRAIVFAVSGGGPGAIYFAHRHPEKCRALVLASTCGGPAADKVPLAFYIMKWLIGFPPFVAWMKKKTEKNIARSLARSISDPDILNRTLANAEVMALYEELKLGMFHRMSERMPGTGNDIRVSQTTSYPLREIQVPTLVIHGTNDPLLPFADHGERLAHEIPGAQLCTADGGEHVAIFTHRGQVQASVAAFLEQVLRAEG
jgi:pimeloyl-ACP methyl ester carboxylesterase